MRKLTVSTVVAAVLAGIPGAIYGGPAAPALVVTSYEFTFEAPDTTASGVVTVRLVNRGKEGHQLSFALLDDTSTVTRAMRELAENCLLYTSDAADE